MTAIAGAINFNSDVPLDLICAAALEAQTAYGAGRPTIRHVGEAALGLNLFPTLSEDRFDRQPITDGRFMLVADIRLDNRDKIIAHLGHTPPQYANRSDADILLASWSRWEARCLERIAGDFAFAVYDRHSRQLTLVRDAVGAKPLSYRQDGATLRFASMPSGVVAPDPLKPDLQALAAKLTIQPPTKGSTFFENVRSLPAGELLRFSPAGLSRHAYWDPSLSYDHVRSFDQTIAEYRERLDDAVWARLRREGPVVALHLSSGYDSSAVTGTAAKLRQPGDRLIAFTSAPEPGLDRLKFRGRIADESAIAASTAASMGIEHVIIRDGSQLLKAMQGHSRFYQEPVANIFNQGWWTEIALAARSMDATTILSAATGNFTISYGSLPVLSYWLRTGRWLHWLREARSAVSNNDVRWRGVLKASFDPWLHHRLVNRMERYFLGAPPEGEFCFVRHDLRQRQRRFFEATGDPLTDRFNLIRLFDFGHHHKGLLAETGIDERDPTADRRLVEFCLSMPPEQLLDGGIYRPVAKAALADRISRPILEQRRRGYQSADWFARLRVADMNAIMEEISASGAAELLNLAEMSRAIAAWSHLDANNATQVARLGRSLTNALAAGVFAAEVERNPSSMGRSNGARASAVNSPSQALD